MYSEPKTTAKEPSSSNVCFFFFFVNVKIISSRPVSFDLKIKNASVLLSVSPAYVAHMCKSPILDL